MRELLPIERREKILELLDKNGLESFSSLAQCLGVSHMTIRRDVHKLEEEGLVIQVSGGVQNSKRINSEPSHADKENLFSAEKRRIGQQAAKLITQHACIYLDAGTTSLALCEYIKDLQKLTVVSNDLEVMRYLASYSNHDLIMTGGIIRSPNRSAVGHLAAYTLENLSIDIAFLSTSSFDLRGITTPDAEKVVVKCAAVKAAKKCVLISDSSKYATVATYIAVPLNQIDTIITDNNLNDNAKEQIKHLGIELITV